MYIYFLIFEPISLNLFLFAVVFLYIILQGLSCLFLANSKTYAAK